MHDLLQQILTFFGHGFCHQFTERTLEAGGLYFSVCARCTGIYLGFIVTTIIVVVLAIATRERYGGGGVEDDLDRHLENPENLENLENLESTLHPKEQHRRTTHFLAQYAAAMPPVRAVVVGALLIVPMALDGVGSYAHIYETTNLIRFITGYLCGMGMGVIVSGGIVGLLPHITQRRSVINSTGKLVGVLLLSGALGALFYTTYGFMGAAAPFIILVCLWFSVSLIVLLIASTTRLWTVSLKQGPTLTPQQGMTLSLTEEDVVSIEQDTAAKHRRLWQRAALIVGSLLAALVILTLLSLLASALGALFPWFVHP